MAEFIEILKFSIAPILVFVGGLLAHKRESRKIDLEFQKWKSEKEAELKQREAELEQIKIDRQQILLEKAKVKEERDIAFKKLEYLPRIAGLKEIKKIERAVDQIFHHTRATRFLILIGVNGKYSINHVSCFWYKYKNKEDDVNPVEVYKNVDITHDRYYKDMLRWIKENPGKNWNIEVYGMPKGILKDIYYQEQITYSKVGFLGKYPIDKENDFLMYFSVSTDADDGGFTEQEKTFINLKIDAQIKPSLTEIKNNE